ncbi:MAG: response regulator transcription factor [Anaerolineales bacterium]|jgi:two-component system KDP operon response regulator KdpE|uniref:response regulator n=1 Tax=Candidatus Villigracilis vicinus TaxID=3140679 RepID=UPI003135AF6D|nr:response regulator transcription factor [Anaerolineales bacterium]MBK7449027.1 response regulator transcription factor [Anaerolineales bacterium]MBK9780767.1 response regulator transcription factor [Anaerolineales bacterium]
MTNPPYAVIIEDDAMLSLIFQTTLQNAGFDTALDIYGNQYQGLIEAEQPALMILDLHLPYASGVDILADVRVRCPKTVIAIVSADIFKLKDLEGKADYVLVKPISVARLLKIAETVKEAL